MVYIRLRATFVDDVVLVFGISSFVIIYFFLLLYSNLC